MAGNIPDAVRAKLGLPPAVKKSGPFSPVSGLSADPTAGDVLRTLSKTSYGGVRFSWHYNEKAKLLVARPIDWIMQHSNLMPESLLTYLRDKANGSGIETR